MKRSGAIFPAPGHLTWGSFLRPRVFSCSTKSARTWYPLFSYDPVYADPVKSSILELKDATFHR
jgi:hypothetical protein